MRRALLLAVLTAACGHQRAALVSAHVTGGPSDAPEVVQGASGTLDCPDEVFPQDLGNSDASGDLRAQHIGAVPLACTVTVAKAGFQPYKALVRDTCAAAVRGGCQTAELRAVLVPQPGKNTASAK
jgi:hypothetical protein